jgi:hypothetical protein
MTATVAVGALAAALASTAAQAQAPATPAPVMIAKITVKLSTHNAKVGDVFAAKTDRGYKLQDGTVIPKGSKITGKVASVQDRKTGNGDSMITFRLDQIEVKGGATVPIKGLVVAIGPPMSPHDLFGANSVMARNTNTQAGTGVGAAGQGTGSSNGMDPNAGLGSAGAKDEDDIRMGSTMQGVSLGKHMDNDWTSILKGFKTEIDLDSDEVVKVQLM